MANTEIVLTECIPSSGCDTFVFYDLTGTQPTQANGYQAAMIGSLAGTIELFDPEGNSVGSVAIVPDGDPDTDYELAPSAFGLTEFEEGVYRTDYTVMNGANQIGHTAVAMFMISCLLTADMAEAKSAYVSKSCGCDDETPKLLGNALAHIDIACWLMADQQDQVAAQAQFEMAENIVEDICNCT